MRYYQKIDSCTSHHLELSSFIDRERREAESKAKTEEFRRQNAEAELAHYIMQESILRDLIKNGKTFEERKKAEYTLPHCLKNKAKWEAIVAAKKGNEGK